MKDGVFNIHSSLKQTKADIFDKAKSLVSVLYMKISNLRHKIISHILKKILKDILEPKKYIKIYTKTNSKFI